MKNLNLFGLLFSTLLLISCGANSQEKEDTKSEQKLSPYAEAEVKINKTNIKINYSSPRAKGREIWNGLVEYGEVWRTGADEASTLEVSNDIMIEGQPLPKGKYAIFTIPEKEEWTIIFNKEFEQWGAFNYKEKEDALRVKIKPVSMNTMTENMSFFLLETGKLEGEMKIAWGKIQAPISITIPEKAED
ncbi:MAG: hypothetical protein ACJAWV_000005 [Flammeovirgaceae bacterium]|jgi:hypothetical protein